MGWLALAHDIRRFQYYFFLFFPSLQRLEIAKTLALVFVVNIGDSAIIELELGLVLGEGGREGRVDGMRSSIEYRASNINQVSRFEYSIKYKA